MDSVLLSFDALAKEILTPSVVQGCATKLHDILDELIYDNTIRTAANQSEAISRLNTIYNKSITYTATKKDWLQSLKHQQLPAAKPNPADTILSLSTTLETVIKSVAPYVPGDTPNPSIQLAQGVVERCLYALDALYPPAMGVGKQGRFGESLDPTIFKDDNGQPLYYQNEQIQSMVETAPLESFIPKAVIEAMSSRFVVCADCNKGVQISNKDDHLKTNHPLLLSRGFQGKPMDTTWLLSQHPTTKFSDLQQQKYAEAIHWYCLESPFVYDGNAAMRGIQGYNTDPFKPDSKFRDSIYVTQYAPYLTLLHRSMQTLAPNYKGTVFRAVSVNVQYEEGSLVTFNQPTSTSRKPNVIRDFLGKPGADGKVRGSILIIRVESGADVSSFSPYPEEAEVLLYPNTQCRVCSPVTEGVLLLLSFALRCDLTNVTVVELRQVDVHVCSAITSDPNVLTPEETNRHKEAMTLLHIIDENNQQETTFIHPITNKVTKSLSIILATPPPSVLHMVTSNDDARLSLTRLLCSRMSEESLQRYFDPIVRRCTVEGNERLLWYLVNTFPTLRLTVEYHVTRGKMEVSKKLFPQEKSRNETIETYKQQVRQSFEDLCNPTTWSEYIRTFSVSADQAMDWFQSFPSNPITKQERFDVHTAGSTFDIRAFVASCSFLCNQHNEFMFSNFKCPSEHIYCESTAHHVDGSNWCCYYHAVTSVCLCLLEKSQVLTDFAIVGMYKRLTPNQLVHIIGSSIVQTVFIRKLNESTHANIYWCVNEFLREIQKKPSSKSLQLQNLVKLFRGFTQNLNTMLSELTYTNTDHPILYRSVNFAMRVGMGESPSLPHPTSTSYQRDVGVKYHMQPDCGTVVVFCTSSGGHAEHFSVRPQDKEITLPGFFPIVVGYIAPSSYKASLGWIPDHTELYFAFDNNAGAVMSVEKRLRWLSTELCEIARLYVTPTMQTLENTVSQKIQNVCIHRLVNNSVELMLAIQKEGKLPVLVSWAQYAQQKGKREQYTLRNYILECLALSSADSKCREELQHVQDMVVIIVSNIATQDEIMDAINNQEMSLGFARNCAVHIYFF